MNILKKDLKKIYLDKTNKIDNIQYRNRSQERHIRYMRKRLHKEFDETWIKYENKQTTYSEWEKALDKWLNSECI